MADNEGTRKSGNFWVVSIQDDVCLTPVGDESIPIPYRIRARLTDSVSDATTVQMKAFDTSTMASRIERVEGDEEGTDGGINSGVNLGYCRPITHSTTVRAEGSYVIYRSSHYWMNCDGPDGLGNTFGEVVFLPDGVEPGVGPLVDLDAMREEAEKSWWDDASGWVHAGLDVAGFIPGVGEIADGLNAAIYLAEGDYANAAISAAGMIPFAGAAATGGRLAARAGKAALGTAAEKGTQRITRETAEEVAARTTREGTEEAAQQGAKQTDGVEVNGGSGGKGDANAGKGDGPDKPGDSSCSSKKDCTAEGHPVDVATGEVVDEATDLSLPGVIPLVIERRYAASRRDHRDAALGPGWSFSLEQWIEEREASLALRDGEGRWIHFDKVEAGGASFHRRERLELRVGGDGTYRVHDPEKRLTRVFEGTGPKALLSAIEDASGNAIRLHHAGGVLARVVDTTGREVVCTWEGGRLTRLDAWVEGQVAQSVAYRYAKAGTLAAVVDAVGGEEAYEYDGSDRMVLARLKNGVCFQYAYDDESGRCVKTWGPDGLHEVALYADLGAGTTLAESEEPKVYTWNDAGLVTREETTTGEVLAERVYDADLFVVEERNGAGDATRFERDARGHLLRVVDAAGNATAWRYEGDRPVARTGPDGLETTYGHDAQGNLVEVRFPTGVTYALSHDARGRLSAIAGPEGPVVQYEYDRQHNVIAETDARGARTAFTYDGLGRPTAMTDALGRTTRLTYDRLGRPVELQQPDGSTTRQTYDAQGNVASVTDALGQVTRMEYAGTGVLTRVTQPDGGCWSFRYTSKERLREIENPLGEVYAFTYDAAGRLVTERTFDGRVLRYGYTKAGHLARIDYPDGSFRAFNHDRLGNIILEHSSDGMATYPRDALGRMLAAVVEEGERKVVTMFERDAFGRIVTERQGDKAVRFAYDARGRRTKRVLPNGATTHYAHDALDALVGVEHDGYRLDIERDVLGRERWRGSVGGPVSIQSQYDAMDRLIEQQVAASAPGTEIAKSVITRAWSYDALGRVTQIQDGRWGATTYRYDRIDQLVEAQRGSLREVFAYDAGGSLRKMLAGLEAEVGGAAWEVAPGNLLEQTERAKYTYDARGRRVVKLALGSRDEGAEAAATAYTWDCRDRLREVRQPDGTRVRFSYDAFGRRVRKEVVPDGAETAARVVDFVWDGDELAADLERARGVRVFVHVPGTFVPLLQSEQGQVFAVVNDHLGMPKELVGPDGRVAWSAAHSAWGRVVEVWRDPAAQQKQAVESPFRLLGQYADEETGLCYTRFRYFDPEVGRWCSPDPLGYAGGDNLSGFDGAPSFKVDPLGLQSDCPSDGNGSQKKARNRPPDPLPEAEGRPHTIIEKPGPEGQYTTHNGDGTFKQYRGSGKPHYDIPRPNVKENKLNTTPDGKAIPGRPTVRPAKPDEIPGGG
ncbi:PAAR-like domain-containing protein [Chondromyces apiculatus]|uniref:Rhs-family protein n=1 Tax=Chondromyces apiculatus DSM 436 TaxID=1192034 RepID=A0A017SWY8_9BACT|nr:PAAR-like domain-containing protein [Chondromyces apiculatus]EYF01095.1 Hypothetical protein CAP_8653 [Chondromyces apiculatus DSM 436]